MRDINVNDEPTYRGPHTPETRVTVRKKEPIKERRQVVLEEAIPDVKAAAQGFFARRGKHRAAVERVRFPSPENQSANGWWSPPNGESAELAYSIGACRITICRNVSAIWLTSEPPEKISFARRLRLLNWARGISVLAMGGGDHDGIFTCRSLSSA